MSRRRSRKRNVSVVIFGLTCPKRILNIKTVMKRLHKYKNLGYALAIFFYVDLSVGAFAYVGKDIVRDFQLKQDAENILNTPDLTTGLEELEHAVQMDLADLEKSFQQNS